MSMAWNTPMTVAAFLDWESQQPAKYEFDGFHPVAMTGGTTAHSRIQRNLLGQLYNGLRGRLCEAHGSDLKIRASQSIRYPDAFVVCWPLPGDVTIVTEPVIVFEILSDGTSKVDRLDKNLEYRNTPSIQRYVILEQTSMAATVYTRLAEEWVANFQIGDTTLDLPEAGLTLRLADLYEGVSFPVRDDASG